jgi:hypothetical protein
MRKDLIAQTKWEKAKEKTRIKSQQYRVKIGKSYWFEYHCWESDESSDAELWHHSHQKVEIIAMTEPGYGDTEEQRFENTQTAMFKVRFSDGLESEAAEDEILESKKQFERPDPPKKKV